MGGSDGTFSYIFITDYFEYFTPTLAYLSISLNVFSMKKSLFK